MAIDTKTVFGFDLGTNSIGWAVLQEDGAGQPGALLDMGVRIFNKAVEDKTPTPKNQKRRKMRLARRVVQRRARRRQRLQNYLIHLGLLPMDVRDSSQRETCLNQLGDPYALRAKGLDQGLSPFELGRAVLHLGMRRGFQSNRKTFLSDMLDDPDVQEMLAELEHESDEGKTEADKARLQEEGQFKQAIHDLQQGIDAAGCRTLGQYLHQQPVSERKRNRRTGREMIRHELQLLLHLQAAHHPMLTDAVRQEIEHIIFHQRPLRWDRDSIGACSLEKHRQRAAVARLEYQRFRLLQDLNNIRYDYPRIDESTGEILGLNLALSATDREKLLARLENQREMKWSAVRKLIGLGKEISFNLEKGSKTKGLTGNSTACTLQGIVGEAVWQAMGPDKQAALVEDLLKFEKKAPLKKRLIHHWGLDVRTAINLATVELEPGHANLSLKAIRRLLPFMMQGMRYDEARVAAGYGYAVEQKAVLARLPAPADLRNPIVNKALHEFRRVCNALIATYGKPAAIRIELPRELGLSGKRKAAFEKQQKANQQANETAGVKYNEVREANPQLALPTYPRKMDKLKYRLWLEQGGVSLYSNRAISMTRLFSADVEVDHILPYSRSLDDSYMNKALAFASENRDKGNRTPYEAYSGNFEQWEQLVQKVRHLPEKKRNNLLCKELDGIDDFINSQLVDTAYLSREVYAYVQVLGCDVSVSKGVLTAWLRHSWGLNPLLGGGEKNRADHRHHAIDAAVISTVSRSFYQRLIREVRSRGERLEGLDFPAPFASFRDVLAEKLAGLIVCHDPIRKLSGALHEETAYGVQTTTTGERVLYRKTVDGNFDAKQINRVADAGLRQQLLAHLEKFPDAKIAFSEANRPVLHPNQGPVRHVRLIAAESFNPNSYLTIRDKNGRIRKLYPYGSNHHVEIVRDKASGKVRGIFVNMWEAAQRAHRYHQPMVQRDHGPDTEFLMALHINDMVTIESDGQHKVYRVQNLDPGGKRLMLRSQIAATLDNKEQGLLISILKLVDGYKAKPLNINILGHVLV